MGDLGHDVVVGFGIHGGESLTEGIAVSLVLGLRIRAQQVGDWMDVCEVMGVVAIVDSVVESRVFGRGCHNSSDVMDQQSA